MKAITSKLCYGIVIVEVLFGLYLGVMAYFVRSFDKTTGKIFDGLGRALEPAPFIVRFILGSDSYWAGWLQFGLELLIFWGGISLGAMVLKFADKMKQK